MDHRAEDVNKASQALLEAEIRLRGIAVQLELVERDIALLKSREAHIEENIDFLKRKRLTVNASEFKLIKLSLRQIQNKIAFLKIDFENIQKMQESAEKIYQKAKKSYELAYELMINPDKNIIRVDFGKKKE